MRDFIIESRSSSYRTFFKTLIKQNTTQGSDQYRAGVFGELANELICLLCQYLDTTSLISFAMSCKFLYMILSKFILNKIELFNKSFLSIKNEYRCSDWTIALDEKDYIIQGSFGLYFVECPLDCQVQIEETISNRLIDCEITTLCNYVAEGVQAIIIIKLPEEFTFFSLEKISEILQLPISSSQIEEQNSIIEGFSIDDYEPTTEDWTCVP